MSSKRTTPKKRPSKVKAQKQAQATTGFQFKITLPGSKPAIWRRFQVPDCTLGDLHTVIQIVMGWEECHMHQFMIGKEYYGAFENDDGFGPEIHDEDACQISELIPAKARVFSMVYEYDFGDSWEHGLELEKRLTADDFAGKAICLAGSGACPPEDSGGIWGYAELLEAFRNKDASEDSDDEDYDDRLEWLRDDFDPKLFSVDKVNKLVKKCFG